MHRISGPIEVSKKLDCIRLGPFEVEAAIGKRRVSSQTPGIHAPSSSRLPGRQTLPPPAGSPSPGRRQPAAPDPIIIDGENYYEVERILDSRVRYRRIEYLVKWNGYNDAHNQWIPWYNLDAEDTIKEFHEQNPDRPAP